MVRGRDGQRMSVSGSHQRYGLVQAILSGPTGEYDYASERLGGSVADRMNSLTESVISYDEKDGHKREQATTGKVSAAGTIVGALRCRGREAVWQRRSGIGRQRAILRLTTDSYRPEPCAGHRRVASSDPQRVACAHYSTRQGRWPWRARPGCRSSCRFHELLLRPRGLPLAT